MADTPAMGRLRGGHYNTSDWNASTNQGGMGGDGHRYALIPPKAPQTPTYPVMVNDLVAVLDEAAASASAAAGSASAAAGSVTTAAQTLTSTQGVLASTQSVLNDARLLLSNATLDGTSDCSNSMTVAADAKLLTVATNKVFRPGHEVQVTRKSSPTTWLRGTVTDYNAGTGSLSVTMTSVNAPNGTGPWSDWTVSTVSRQDATGGATAATLSGTLTLTSASARVQSLDPNGANRDVVLPAANGLANTGGPVFIIRNAMAETGALYVLDIKDNAGTLLRSLYPGDVAYVSLLSRASAAGVWDIAVINREEGGATVNVALSADLVLDRRTNRGEVFHLAPTDANRSVTLPAATTVDFLGGPLWYIRNAATNFPLTVKNSAGTVLARLSPQQTAIISCYNRSSAAGGWAVDVIGDSNSGTATIRPMTAGIVLNTWSPRVQQLNPTVANLTVDLPDATIVGTLGSPIFRIHNTSRTQSLTIRAFGGVWPIATIPTEQMATITLIDRSRPPGQWQVSLAPLAPNQPLVTNTYYFSRPIAGSGERPILSATSLPGTVVCGYMAGRSLRARKLTISNGAVTAGPDNILVQVGDFSGYFTGQCCPLTDTKGIAVYIDNISIRVRGFDINLASGNFSLNGAASIDDWYGDDNISSWQVRLAKIPGYPNHCLATIQRDSDNSLILARLLKFDGNSLQVSSMATVAITSSHGPHDTMAISGTQALHVTSNYSGQLVQRLITFDPAAMTLSIGSPVSGSASRFGRSLIRIDGTKGIFCGYTSDGNPILKQVTVGGFGPDVSVVGGAAGDVGTAVMTGPSSGQIIFTNNSGPRQLMFQEFTVTGTSPFLTLNASELTTLDFALANYINPLDTAGLALNATTSLFSMSGNLFLAIKY